MKLRFSYIAFIISCLSMAVIFSALLVVYSKQQCRTLYASIQNITMQSSRIQEKWSRLSVEQRTLLTELRIETVAMNNLQMHLPNRKRLAFLQL